MPAPATSAAPATAVPLPTVPATPAAAPTAANPLDVGGIEILDPETNTFIRRSDKASLGRQDEGEQEGEGDQALSGSGSDVERSALRTAYAQLAAARAEGGEWRAAGPAPIDGVYIPQGRIPGSGRINGIAIDPRDTNVMYVAAAAGGLWKSTDAGDTWRSLGDRQVPAFYGGVVLDPRNPDTVFALLGVFAGSETNVYGYTSSGLLRSRDGGDTWELLAADVFNAQAVTELIFAEDGTLYAASGQFRVRRNPPDQAEAGIFKSTDGGDTWQRLLACGAFANCAPPQDSGYRSLQGGFMDLDLASNGTLYTTLCEYECEGMHLLRSRDGGQTWQELSFLNVIEAWEAKNKRQVAHVLKYPERLRLFGLELAVSRTDPDSLLAGGGLYMDTDPDPAAQKPWSYAMRSTDGGDTWEWLQNAGEYCASMGYSQQCVYDNVVEIDPTDAQIMYLGGSYNMVRGNVWGKMVRRSADGGDTWTDLTPGRTVDASVHPDVHTMAFDPQDPNVIWLGTDGGLHLLRDASAKDPTWQFVNAGLQTLLIVDIGLHPTDPDYIIAGLQDNGNAYTTDGGRTWNGASQGDGGVAAVDPFKPNIVYSEYPRDVFTRNENGGAGGMGDWFGDGDGYTSGLNPKDEWYFYSPFVTDPNNEGVIYFASNRVYRTTNRGDRWAAVSGYLSLKPVRTLALAPSDSQVLYAGTDDGRLWVTNDGAKTWTEVTAPAFPARPIMRVVVDPEDPQAAYAAFGGFNRQTLEPGHIFRTTDGGQSWADISLNLPDAPLSAAVVDARPQYRGVYVGGATGVWVLREGATEWRPFGTGLPYALVSDLELNPRTGVLAVGTFGRGVYVMRMP